MTKSDLADAIGKHIDESYDTMVAATLLAGQTGVSTLFPSDEHVEAAADAAVRLRAKVRAASRA